MSNTSVKHYLAVKKTGAKLKGLSQHYQDTWHSEFRILQFPVKRQYPESIHLHGNVLVEIKYFKKIKYREQLTT